MLQVVAATRTAMMVVVESYDAYVLEEYAGSTERFEKLRMLLLVDGLTKVCNLCI